MMLNMNLSIDLSNINDNHFCEEVLQLLRAVKGDWFKNNDSLRDVTSRVFTEGISNHLFGYFRKNKGDDDVVMVRIYGQGTSVLVDRAKEVRNIQALNAAGRCPPLFAIFNNGIAYGFAHGCIADKASVTDKNIRKLIAKEMLLIHQIHPSDAEVKSLLWEKLYYFHDLIPENLNSPEQLRFEATIQPKLLLRQELDCLKEHLDRLNSPIVFCHNDLAMSNIIYNENKGSVTFIDFEYASYNHEHYDIGVHFLHYLGPDVDIRQYPDKEYQLEWLRYYLEQKAILSGGSEENVTDRDVEENYVTVNKFVLAAHLSEGFWGLIQAKKSSIEFDYIEYARKHLEEYFVKKKQFLC